MDTRVKPAYDTANVEASAAKKTPRDFQHDVATETAILVSVAYFDELQNSKADANH
jgi:hypothetical protein